jgi:predicted glycosyltransferase
MDIVPLFRKVAGPFIETLLSPDVCNNFNLENKSIKYASYHELAYLHPNHFTPDPKIVEAYGIDTSKPYFVMRFASLNAHHDSGIKGINTEIAQRLIDILENSGSPTGLDHFESDPASACSLSPSACSLSADSGNKPRIYITSERPLEPQFEQYRIKINPLDMHHVMAFASLYIGDSQTMAAEAGVLGVPFVRFNDFVGRIGYLRELEDKYELGYGIKASAEGSVDALCERVETLVSMPSAERKATFVARRAKMLEDKIDCAKFLTWFIENYPASATETRKATPEFWLKFK